MEQKQAYNFSNGKPYVGFYKKVKASSHHLSSREHGIEGKLFLVTL